MGLKEKIKETFNSLVEPDNEKKMQQLTDGIIEYIFKKITETYSWMKDGVELLKDNYRQGHDERLFRKLFREKEENKTNPCKPTYKWGPTVCFTSRYFYDKSFMQYFCNVEGCGPDVHSIFKSHGAKHSYCECSTNSRRKQKETLINPN